MSQPDTLTSPAVRPRVWVGSLVYLGTLVAAGGLFLLVWKAGGGLIAGGEATTVAGAKGGGVDVVLHVLATLVAVIALGLALGRVCRWIGQPPVIGEVIAGILLGPSVLGAVWPDAMHALIPAKAADPNGLVPAAVKAVAQIGVVLYMFLVGLELNAARLKKQAAAAVAVSHAGILAPFVLGSAVALLLFPTLAPAGTPFLSFALFMGVATAITAFPVLARILTDRKMERTELGVVALGCAAADDVTAWCLLAVVVGVAQAEAGRVVGVLAGAGAFVAVMLFAVRPLVGRLSRRLDAGSGPLPTLVTAGTFLAVLMAALTTEAIGIHALFGAFLLGAVVPHDGRLAREFNAKLRDPVTVLLLPAFFAYTGMRMQLGLMGGWAEWGWCGLIVLVATVGKFGGAMLAARLTGQGWRSAAALGALMNTRGLMELIVLNIGLDMGVISPTLFAMMVVMALVTTAMTSPLLSLILRQPPAEEPVPAPG